MLSGMLGESVQPAVRKSEIWVWPTSSPITEPKIVRGAGFAFDNSLQDYRLQSTDLGRDLGAHSSSVQRENLTPGWCSSVD